jgi:ParB-like chromosome segregation protein Spo0J
MTMNPPPVTSLIRIIAEYAKTLDIDARVALLNECRSMLHEVSPFKSEPVDFVAWTKAENVYANDYNPNSVAPPEMELLRLSVAADGYTQPIVGMRDSGAEIYEVVDGFHRNRVGRECKDIQARIHGYLPVVNINTSRSDRGDRIASTIRHNRARGKHQVEAMSDIVIELKRRNWSDERICRELGMDADEVLRLCQITGLTELFSDQEFSKSWDVEGEINEADFIELTDDTSTYGPETEDFRTVNTSDETRIFHTYDKWECYKAGFYNNFPPDGMTKESCESAYREFLADTGRFSAALEIVVADWKHSCEHYLTNASMNRVAWLGQAAMCQASGVPAVFRSGFFLLTEAEQAAANEVALTYLNKWLTANSREAVTMEIAYSGSRQSDIY